MLGKLIKYELKATARVFLLLYAAVILLAIVNRIFFGFGSVAMLDGFDTFYTIIVGSFVTLYVLAIIALMVAVMIVVIQRFYKNLFGDEGYLMFTLPVKSWQHIISKMLTASIWMAANTIVIIISVLVLISIPEVFEGFRYGIESIMHELSILEFSVAPFVFEFVFCMLMGTIGYALPLYACISIGQLWKKHRVLGAFCAYFGLNFVTQIVTSIVTSIISVPMMMRLSDLSYDTPEYIQYMLQYVHTIMIIAILISVALYVVYFFVTKLILDKKLDLE